MEESKNRFKILTDKLREKRSLGRNVIKTRPTARIVYGIVNRKKCLELDCI